jgi:hypothetical protein
MVASSAKTSRARLPVPASLALATKAAIIAPEAAGAAGWVSSGEMTVFLSGIAASRP